MVEKVAAAPWSFREVLAKRTSTEPWAIGRRSPCSSSIGPTRPCSCPVEGTRGPQRQVWLTWDEDSLYVAIEATTGTFRQTKTEDAIWREDSA